MFAPGGFPADAPLRAEPYPPHAASEPIWQGRGTKPPYDGVTEVWLDSMEFGPLTDEVIAAGQK